MNAIVRMIPYTNVNQDNKGGGCGWGNRWSGCGGVRGRGDGGSGSARGGDWDGVLVVNLRDFVVVVVVLVVLAAVVAMAVAAAVVLVMMCMELF